jgi:hypothetical protein
MNEIYLLGGSRHYPDYLNTDNFATDEEGLQRIVRMELSTFCLEYDRIVVDMAAEVVRVIGEDGDVINKFHIWTVRRLP